MSTRARCPLRALPTRRSTGSRPIARDSRPAWRVMPEADLTCYRAEGPRSLPTRQDKSWDELLAWARRRFDVDFATTHGIAHVPQTRPRFERLGHAVAALDPFQLAGLSPLVTIGAHSLRLLPSSNARSPRIRPGRRSASMSTGSSSNGGRIRRPRHCSKIGEATSSPARDSWSCSTLSAGADQSRTNSTIRSAARARNVRLRQLSAPWRGTRPCPG